MMDEKKFERIEEGIKEFIKERIEKNIIESKVRDIRRSLKWCENGRRN